MLRAPWFLITALMLFFGLAAPVFGEVVVVELRHRPAVELLPAIQPLLSDSAAVSALDNRLILKGSAAELKNLETLVRQLDVEAVMFRIAVRQEQREDGMHSSVGGAGRSLSTYSVAPGDGRIGHSLGNMRQNVEQYIQVLDGAEAYIEVGRQIPVTTFRSFLTGTQTGYAELMSTQEVSTGFFVRPHLLGEKVLLEVTPHLSFFDSIPDKGIDFSSVNSRVLVPLNVWYDLAGQLVKNDETSREIMSVRVGEGMSERQLWIKITK